MIQYLSITDKSPSAEFPYGHAPCRLLDLQGVGVSVWTYLRWMDLSQTCFGEIYFHWCQRWGLQVPGECAFKIQQREIAGVSLDDVAITRCCGAIWQEKVSFTIKLCKIIVLFYKIINIIITVSLISLKVAQRNSYLCFAQFLSWTHLEVWSIWTVMRQTWCLLTVETDHIALNLLLLCTLCIFCLNC